MMDLGVIPDVVFGGLSSEAGAVLLEQEGVELIPAPTMILEPDFEAIAAKDPDLIVLTTPGATITDTYPKFSEIAPTIVLPYEKPWQEIEITGQAFQREAEAVVQRGLSAVTQDSSTTIVVSHRLQATASADLLLVMVRGRVGQRETHTELLGSSGLYRELWEAPQ